MRFKNNSETRIHLKGYGWTDPGDELEIQDDDEKAIRACRALVDFEELKAAAPKKKTAKKVAEQKSES